MSEKCLIGVDIGGTTTKIAFIQNHGEVVEKWELPTDNENHGKYITINISKSIKQKLVEHKMKINQIKGIGVGAPGPANKEKGIMENTPNLDWHDHYPLRNVWRKKRVFLSLLIMMRIVLHLVKCGKAQEREQKTSFVSHLEQVLVEESLQMEKSFKE